MKYYIYTNYNRKVNAYERPLFMMEDPDEYVERLTRDFKASEEAAQVKMAEYDIYYRGIYDDNKATFDLVEPNLIFHLADLLAAAKQDEEKEDVKNA